MSNRTNHEEQLHGCLRMAEKLARQYAHRMPPYFRQHEEDFVQEARLAVLKAWKSFNPERGLCFSTFCMRPIKWALSRAQSRIRRHHGTLSLETPCTGTEELRIADALPAEGDLEAETVNEQHLHGALAALARCNPRQHEALRRFYLESAPDAEIAPHLGLSPHSVAALKHRGLRRLREFYGAEL